MAKVLPIYKSEDEQLVQNYRPISILPFFLKFFEKMMSNYLIEFIEENKLFYENQFRFRKQHSTSHAIITLIEKSIKSFGLQGNGCWSICRLKTVFDTVDHTILLRKLEVYGIHGKIHDWFSSYLNNRT